MYRPTVRMADVYKEYFEGLAEKTKLDRTQVLRLALFTAAHSLAFLEIINEYKKDDVDLGTPLWNLWDDCLFLEASPVYEVGKGGGVLEDSLAAAEKVYAQKEIVEAKAQVIPPKVLTWTLPAARTS